MSPRPTDRASDIEAQDQLTELDELGGWVLAKAALDGLADMAEGRLVEDGELEKALAVVLPQPRFKDRVAWRWRQASHRPFPHAQPACRQQRLFVSYSYRTHEAMAKNTAPPPPSLPASENASGEAEGQLRGRNVQMADPSIYSFPRRKQHDGLAPSEDDLGRVS
ncbi:hypothetical protein [Roseateles flavus]|uniref:Uncharacterized protein n=1 Tax=Roseateles flavus TaxID=3149041 RepID=A0ABV0G8T0_9BURK